MRQFLVTLRVESYSTDDALTAKEAVAQCLEGLGAVQVIEVKEERQKQLRMVDGEYRYE